MKELKKKVKNENTNISSQVASIIKKDILQDVPIKKKRGRKKKIKTPEEIEREKNKPKQRRGRKPKSQMVVRRDISEYINNEDKDETIILNLKIDNVNNNNIDNKELHEQFNCNNKLKYSPSINYPIGYDNTDTFSSLPSKFLDNQNSMNQNSINQNSINQNSMNQNTINQNTINQNTINQNTINQNTINQNTINQNSINQNSMNQNSMNQNSMNQNSINQNTINQNSINENINEINEKKNTYSSLELFLDNSNWKNKTNILCWWCCHTFENTPFGIPIKYKNKKFHVSGCFCSLECASSYNFNESNGVQDVWESYSLINLLSQKIGYKNIVKLAPHKVCLKIFGGKLDINEFRNFTNKNKIINVLDYPMIPSNQQLEEINYNTHNNMNNFIPIDENRLKQIEQKIKLSRKKPLNNNKNTLEHTMNIKISVH